MSLSAVEDFESFVGSSLTTDLSSEIGNIMDHVSWPELSMSASSAPFIRETNTNHIGNAYPHISKGSTGFREPFLNASYDQYSDNPSSRQKTQNVSFTRNDVDYAGSNYAYAPKSPLSSHLSPDLWRQKHTDDYVNQHSVDAIERNQETPRPPLIHQFHSGSDLIEHSAAELKDQLDTLLNRFPSIEDHISSLKESVNSQQRDKQASPKAATKQLKKEEKKPSLSLKSVKSKVNSIPLTAAALPEASVMAETVQNVSNSLSKVFHDLDVLKRQMDPESPKRSITDKQLDAAPEAATKEALHRAPLPKRKPSSPDKPPNIPYSMTPEICNFVKREVEKAVHRLEQDRIVKYIAAATSEIERRILEKVDARLEEAFKNAKGVNHKVRWDSDVVSTSTSSYTASPNNETIEALQRAFAPVDATQSGENAQKPNARDVDHDVEVLLGKLRAKLDQKAKLVREINIQQHVKSIVDPLSSTYSNIELRDEARTSKQTPKPIQPTAKKVYYNRPTVASQMKTKAFR